MLDLDSQQKYEIKRLKLREYLKKSPDRESWHQVARRALSATDGDGHLAGRIAGVLAEEGREESVSVLDHIRARKYDTSNREKVRNFFEELWGPCIILDYKEKEPSDRGEG